jgi:hypothetical protein
MNRRKLLQHTATGIAGIGAGYALLDASTGNASAAVSMGTLDVSDASKTTQDGQIDDVKADVSGQWEYNLPAGKNPNQWSVTLSVANSEDVAQIAQTAGNAKYLQNSGTYELSGSVTDTHLYSADDFKAPEGKVKSVTLGLVVVFAVLADDGSVLARAQLEDTAEVAVTNEAYQASDYGDASGEGTLIIVDG